MRVSVSLTNEQAAAILSLEAQYGPRIEELQRQTDEKTARLVEQKRARGEFYPRKQYYLIECAGGPVVLVLGMYPQLDILNDQLHELRSAMHALVNEWGEKILEKPKEHR